MATDFLNLPAFRVVRIDESFHDYHVTSEPIAVQSVCTSCGSENFGKWGSREQLFRDLFIRSLARQIAILRRCTQEKQKATSVRATHPCIATHLGRHMVGFTSLVSTNNDQDLIGVDSEESKNYGADIGILTRMIEDGEI